MNALAARGIYAIIPVVSGGPFYSNTLRCIFCYKQTSILYDCVVYRFAIFWVLFVLNASISPFRAKPRHALSCLMHASFMPLITKNVL